MFDDEYKKKNLDLSAAQRNDKNCGFIYRPVNNMSTLTELSLRTFLAKEYKKNGEEKGEGGACILMVVCAIKCRYDEYNTVCSFCAPRAFSM